MGWTSSCLEIMKALGAYGFEMTCRLYKTVVAVLEDQICSCIGRFAVEQIRIILLIIP